MPKNYLTNISVECERDLEPVFDCRGPAGYVNRGTRCQATLEVELTEATANKLMAMFAAKRERSGPYFVRLDLAEVLAALISEMDR